MLLIYIPAFPQKYKMISAFLSLVFAVFLLLIPAVLGDLRNVCTLWQKKWQVICIIQDSPNCLGINYLENCIYIGQTKSLSSSTTQHSKHFFNFFLNFAPGHVLIALKPHHYSRGTHGVVNSLLATQFEGDRLHWDGIWYKWSWRTRYLKKSARIEPKRKESTKTLLNMILEIKLSSDFFL